jgi:hypothetical protein
MPEWIKTYQPLLTLVLAFLALIWPVAQAIMVRKREAYNREFDNYHNIVKMLVQGDGGTQRLDRQCAAVYELRNYPRYFPVTHRMLSGLQTDWAGNQELARLLAEIEKTLKFISRSGESLE